MKYKFLLLVMLPVLLLLRCATDNKIKYNIPTDVTGIQRKEIIDNFKKGQELYKINCSECHGIFTAGKDSIPNFTDVQFDNYSAKFLRHDPKNHAVIKQMSPEQLNEVLTFLRYKQIKK